MSNLNSCQPGKPLIELDKNGDAPTLNYNLPQATCYDINSPFQLKVDNRLYKVSQKKPPLLNYWDLVRKVPKEELLTKMKNNISVKPGLKLVENYHVLKNNPLITKMASSLVQKAKTDNEEHQVKKAISTPDLDIVERIKEGLMPVVTQRFSGLKELKYQAKPLKAKPTITIVLHLKMCSFLGDYGAGKTLKTFSLLPGEKTSIRMRSYQYQETIREATQNILDSYSESSAEDLQDSLESENNSLSYDSSLDVDTESGSWNAGGGASLDLAIIKIGGGGGGGGTSSSYDSLSSASLSQASVLSNVTSRHVSKSDALREIEINTSTESTSSSSQSNSVVRHLENINKSRVLNFVFRQLLQEFISLIYVHDVSIVYSTGFPSQRKSCKLSGLENMLSEVLVNNLSVQKIKNEIYTHLSSLVDYQDTRQSLIEKVSEKLHNSIDEKAKEKTMEYVRVRKDLKQEYRGKTINGIILNATHRVLRTPSVIVESLLGQGEALDCYNSKMQDAATTNADLENQKLSKALELMESVSDVNEKAKLFNLVFGCNKAETE